MECDIDEIESRFDDLFEAQRLVSAYRNKRGALDCEMKRFVSDVKETLQTFRSAISSLDEGKVQECRKKYQEALDGEDYDEKFATYWREMLTKKVSHKFSFRRLQNLFSLRLKNLIMKSVVILKNCGATLEATETRNRGTHRQFLENICSEDSLRSRIFATFLACLPLRGFSNI